MPFSIFSWRVSALCTALAALCRIHPCFWLRCTRRSPQFWSTISVHLSSRSRYPFASAQVREVIHDAGALNSKPALSAVPTPSVGTSFACVAHEDRPCCPNVVNCLQSRECLLPLLDMFQSCRQCRHRERLPHYRQPHK